MKMFAICVLLCMPATALAQEPRVQLPTEMQRKVADAASWATALTTVALDTRASWDCPDRRRCFTTQGARLGVTYGVVYLVKKLVHRKRPCYPDCGIDNPFSSFYSAHTALAFQSVGGPRLMFTIPLSIGTGGLRVAAGKHWITDTLVGAGAGLLTSRIR
jgi:membrane-associated phospholipid phosphatase